MLSDLAPMMFLEQSSSDRQKGAWRLPGAAGKRKTVPQVQSVNFARFLDVGDGNSHTTSCVEAASHLYKPSAEHAGRGAGRLAWLLEGHLGHPHPVSEGLGLSPGSSSTPSSFLYWNSR